MYAFHFIIVMLLECLWKDTGQEAESWGSVHTYAHSMICVEQWPILIVIFCLSKELYILPQQMREIFIGVLFIWKNNKQWLETLPMYP